MKEKTEKIKAYILLPVFIALLTATLIAVGAIHSIQSKQIFANANTKLTQTRDLLQLLLRDDTKLLGNLSSSTSRYKNLQQAWLKKDQQTLLQHALPLFNKMKIKYGITHFYFITLDKKCFLRVHRPCRQGDIINRLTLKKAITSGTVGTGIELGPLGTLTLRFVYPWYINGKLSGYIELGQEIDHVITSLHEILDVELVMMAKKKLLNQSRWQQTMQSMARDHDWQQFEDLVIIDSTMKKSPELERSAYNQHMASHQQDSYKPNLHITSVNGRIFSAGFIPLIDAGENDIGEIFILSDITAEQAALRKFTSILVISSILVMLIVFVLFYQYIDRIEQRLVKSRQQILEQSQDREATLLEAKNVAEEINQMKSQFLANMSHELRTPMNGVMGMLQVLGNTKLSEEQQGYLKVAHDSSHIMLDLLNDLLDFSKIDTGNINTEQCVFDLHKMVRSIVNRYSDLAVEKGLEMACHIDGDVPELIEANPKGLEQILDNLVGNAVKFTQQGKITIHLGIPTPEDEKNMLYFEIIDTGIGIPAELHGVIFNSFIQVDASSTRNFAGAGLGLAIAKSNIEQAGGRVGVKSSPDKGSCFYFTLPFVNIKTNK